MTKGKNLKTHGLSKHPLYPKWARMIQRCYNEKASEYQDYGYRGIKVCDEWRNDPKSFIKYISNLDYYGDPVRTLDRIKNDGNYEPGNVRWGTRHQQSTNQRIKKNNRSGYTGVYFYKNKRKWVANIRINRKTVYIGIFENKLDAVMARDQYIIDNELWEYRIQILNDPRDKNNPIE